MFKRMLVLFTCLCVVFSISACASAPAANEVEKETLPDGSFYSTNASGQKEWHMNTVPFTMSVDGKEVELHDIDFFEIYADHGYTAWIIVTIDRQNLSDDDIYWITKAGTTLHKDLDAYVYHTRIDGTEVDSNRLTEVGSLYSEDYLYYAFHTDLSRDSYMGEEFSCTIRYSPEIMTNPDGIVYYYWLEVTEENYSDSVDVLTEEAAKALHQMLT